MRSNSHSAGMDVTGAITGASRPRSTAWRSRTQPSQGHPPRSHRAFARRSRAHWVTGAITGVRGDAQVPGVTKRRSQGAPQSRAIRRSRALGVTGVITGASTTLDSLEVPPTQPIPSTLAVAGNSTGTGRGGATGGRQATLGVPGGHQRHRSQEPLSHEQLDAHGTHWAAGAWNGEATLNSMEVTNATTHSRHPHRHGQLHTLWCSGRDHSRGHSEWGYA
jgi:hypothetical protein